MNQITIMNSIFTHVCAYNGGAIYLQGFSDINIVNSNFTHCSSVDYGGAIFTSNYKKLQMDNLVFSDNSGGLGGSDLLVLDSLAPLTLSHSSFTRSQNNSAILSIRASLTISSSSF